MTHMVLIEYHPGCGGSVTLGTPMYDHVPDKHGFLDKYPANK